jgi:uncharacterized DUF497 family protein
MAVGREFEWDEPKAARNLIKHGVPFAYAIRVFLDAAVVDFDASQPGDDEIRRKAVGLIEGRIFTVVYTQRGVVTRIISARRCNAKEAKYYGSL